MQRGTKTIKGTRVVIGLRMIALALLLCALNPATVFAGPYGPTGNVVVPSGGSYSVITPTGVNPVTVIAPKSMWLGTPDDPYAYGPHTASPYGPVCPYAGLTNRIVTCINTTVLWATTRFLIPMSQYMYGTISIVLLLAVTLYGFLLYTGRAMAVSRETVILAIKIGAVVMFTWNFAGLFPYLLGSIDSIIYIMMSQLVTSITIPSLLKCPFAMNIWQQVDCSIDQLIGGIGSVNVLSGGAIGFIISSMFSGPIGFAIFLLGISFIISIIMALVQAVYIFLSAYVGIGFMIVISPLFIPLILFRSTKAYFEKWLRLTTGLVLQPLFLFAYLVMLLVAMDITIFSGPRSVYGSIVGPVIASQPTFTIGGYMIANGAFAEKSQADWTMNLDPSQMAAALGAPGLEQTGMLGKLGNWSQSNIGALFQKNNVYMDMPVKVVDFQRLNTLYNLTTGMGLTLEQYLLQILFSIFTAVAVGYIFYTMLQSVPYLSVLLSGDILSLPGSLGGMSQKVGSSLENLREGLRFGRFR